ncbi:MAG: class I SAM-dependent methyltransferase, partial [Lachnospiraceae bacterium]|nr:class I SAM-dependent methyltransferase [Lachnospiraceae bacterium]
MGIKLEGLENEIHEFETIGKVTLDLRKYPGEDLYSDGAVEEELLRIARDLSPIEYGRVIDDSASWPILYHFSSQRENIVEWIPLKSTDKVLDIGSGCGAVAGALAKKAGSVTCVDLSRMRSKINAYRHSDCENLSIKVGNFKDVEPELDRNFDLICLIGVFEYGISYMGGETPFEDFLKIIKSHVKPGGRIVIAIENKLGLKYFAGCREDHMGTYFSGITNYVDGGHARTF